MGDVVQLWAIPTCRLVIASLQAVSDSHTVLLAVSPYTSSAVQKATKHAKCCWPLLHAVRLLRGSSCSVGVLRSSMDREEAYIDNKLRAIGHALTSAQHTTLK